MLHACNFSFFPNQTKKLNIVIDLVGPLDIISLILVCTMS